MRRQPLVVAVLLVAALFVSLANADINRVDDDFIRCKVCQRAIEHVFRAGAELRTHCKEVSTDPRCDYSNLHHFGIHEMVHTACDDLPKNYQAIHDSEFDMVVHDDPQHAPEVALAIKRTCVDWVHDQHDDVANYIFANLDAQKSMAIVLPSLQNRFCKLACLQSYKKKRDFHDNTDEL
jgi:hypothetical protein